MIGLDLHLSLLLNLNQLWFVLRILLCRLGPFVRLHSIHYSDFQVQTLARQFSIVILQSEHFFKKHISKVELASSICLLEFLVSANSFLIPSFSSSISLNKGSEWDLNGRISNPGFELFDKKQIGDYNLLELTLKRSTLFGSIIHGAFQ